MKVKSGFQFILSLSILFCSAVTFAQNKLFTYSGSSAATYARNNAWVSYGTAYNQNPFCNLGNNCANFVSQAIVAGMIRKTNPWDVYFSRYDFLADLSTPTSYPRWFFLSCKSTERGPAWSGAKEMHQYANWNKSTYKGLHFKFVASDTPSKRTLDYTTLRVGDVIFCDWQNDGTIDHVLMISRIDTSLFVWNKYNRIHVAGQSNNHVDTALQWIIDETYRTQRTWASFRVYRPLDYNQAGL